MHCQVRPQEGRGAPRALEECQEARFRRARQTQQSRAGTPHQPCHLGVGRLHGLGLQAQPGSRGLDPQARLCRTVLSQPLRGCGGLSLAQGQTAMPCQHCERLAQACQGPGQCVQGLH